MKKSKFLIIIVVILLVLVLLIIGLKKYFEKVNQDEIDSSIHGVVIAREAPFYAKAEKENVKQLKLLERGENVYILDEFEKDGIDWYKVKVDGKTNGYMRAENVDYYEEVNSEKVLVTDVSHFNIGKSFDTMEEFQVFLLESKIDSVYIRAGGRGYGTEGNFYYDQNYKDYIDACEYLGIPYGFYFLDEALNDEEIEEEVEFIKNFLNENAGPNHKLPVAIDIEKHVEKGRCDDIWLSRATLVQKLLDRLNEENIDTIVYTNAKIADLYLSTLNTEFWIAYYPDEGEIPDYWYFDTDQEAAKNVELEKKTIGWQFTESGAGIDIPVDIDMSIMKKDFYKKNNSIFN